MIYLKVHRGKSQLLLNLKEKVSITSEDTIIKNSSSKILLVVLIDDKLIFNDHVSKSYKKQVNK